MYQIRIRRNKRLDEYGKDDRTTVAVRLRNGEHRFLHWQGFTLHVRHPVKLLIEAYTCESAWDPRRSGSRMPEWQVLDPGEYLLGSYDSGVVRTVLPFTVVPG